MESLSACGVQAQASAAMPVGQKTALSDRPIAYEWTWPGG